METAKISLWEVIIGIWILAIVVILGGIFLCRSRYRMLWEKSLAVSRRVDLWFIYTEALTLS